VAVLVRRPQTVLRWRLLLALVGALVLGLTPFATQPIRAAYNPPINEGDPTACRHGLHLSCTFSAGTKDAFMYNFNRGQFGKPALSDRQAPAAVQFGLWWLYFKWQWLRDPHLQHQVWQGILGGLFLVLGLFGGWVHFQRDRRSFWFFGTFMFTVTLLLIYYLNFRYTTSQAPELGNSVPREPRDRDYFFLWSFSAWGVWAALGLMYIWENLAALIGTRDVRSGGRVATIPSPRAAIVTSPVLLIACIPLFTNWSTAPRRGQTFTRDFAHDLLDSVEPYGVLITVGDNDTFPLWYAQEVEGIRRDVVVVCTSLLNIDWYARQIIRRPIYPYDAANGPAIYRGRQWVRPSAPPLRMSLDEADSVPPYFQMTGPMVFNAGAIHTVVQPQILQRADLLVLHMIQDSYPGRPIYFSRSSAGYARQLGLGDFVLTQAFASKVFLPPRAQNGDTLYVAGDGWLDLPRTRALWFDVFQGARSVVKQGDWIDQPSVGIPYLYIATGLELSAALGATGSTALSRQAYGTAAQVARAVHLEQLLPDQPPSAQPRLPLPARDSSGVPLPPAASPGTTPD
ncbi:MAG TPA: hypothetical protein VJU87_02990, partial [Gemmatimonadaceae bacterium]|nr:hypothetical protein [Gemmatimonadaceae bacterium]